MPLDQRTVASCLNQADLLGLEAQIRGVFNLGPTSRLWMYLTPDPKSTYGYFDYSIRIADSATSSTDVTLKKADVDRKIYDVGMSLLHRLDHATLPPSSSIGGQQVLTLAGTYSARTGPWFRTTASDVRKWLMGSGAGPAGKLPQHEVYDVDPARWSLSNDGALDGPVVQTLTDVLLALVDDNVITSPVGARIWLDHLIDNDEGDTDVRVVAELGLAPLLGDHYSGLRCFFDPARDGDPMPGITRLVNAVTAIVDAGNSVLTKFFKDFQPRN